MTTPQPRCRVCPHYQQLLCACCGQAGYCSEACRKKDWDQVHQYEQVIVPLKQHTEQMRLDAKTARPTSRHGEAYTRVRRRPRRAGKKGGDGSYTVEDIERELRRLNRRGEERQRDVSAIAEEMQEEMEVIRNTMPEPLQRLKDSFPDVIQSYEQTMMAVLEASQTRFGIVITERDLQATAPLSPELRERLESVLSSPEAIMAQHEQNYVLKLLEAQERMNAMWQELGDERRVEITPEHQTAIAYHSRLVRLVHARAALAQLTREPPHLCAWRVAQLQLDEFNQRLTHGIFLEGLVDYDEVVKSGDAARFDVWGREEGTLMFDTAIGATADVLVRLALGEEVDITLSFFKGSEEGASGDGFMANMRAWLADVMESPDSWVGRVGTMLSNVAAAARGLIGAQYEQMHTQGVVTQRFVDNSNRLVASRGDEMVTLMKHAEKDNGKRLNEALTDEMATNERWLGRSRAWISDWLDRNSKRVSACVMAGMASTLLVLGFGHYIRSSEPVHIEFEALVSKLARMGQTVGLASESLKKTQDSVNELSTLINGLLTEEEIQQQEALYNMTFTEENVMTNNLGLHIQLKDFERNLVDKLGEVSKSSRMFALFEETIERLKSYGPGMDFQKRVESLTKIQDELKGAAMYARAGSAVKSIEEYKKLLTSVKQLTDHIVKGQHELAGIIQQLDAACAEAGTDAISLQRKVWANQIKTPFTNSLPGKWGIDTSELAPESNGVVDPTFLDTLGDGWAWLFSTTMTVAFVRNIGRWMHQCEARTFNGLQLFYDLWANIGGNPLYTAVNGAWALGALLVSPWHSPFITVYYIMHGVKTLAEAPLRLWNSARYVPYMVKWLKRWVTGEKQDVFQATTWDDWFGGGEGVGGGGGGAATVAGLYDNKDARRDARKIVREYMNAPNKLAAEEQIAIWKRELDDGIKSKAVFGLILAYLHDEVLAGRLYAFTQPNVETLRTKTAKEDVQDHIAYNAERYVAATLAGRAQNGWQRWKGIGWQAAKDLYTVTGHFALLHQAHQMWYMLKGLYGLTLATLNSTNGGYALTAIGTVLTVPALWDATRIYRMPSNRLWHNTPAKALMALAGGFVNTLNRYQIPLAVGLGLFLKWAVVWDNTYWAYHQGRSATEAVYNLFAGDGYLVEANPITTAALAKAEAEQFVNATNALANRTTTALTRAEDLNVVTSSFYDFLTVCDAEANRTLMVRDSEIINDAMINYKTTLTNAYSDVAKL